MLKNKNRRFLAFLISLILMVGAFPVIPYASNITVNTPIVNSSTDTQATFTGSFNLDAAGNFNAGFVYATTDMPTNANSMTSVEAFSSSASTTTPSAFNIGAKTASGLSPNTRYYVRAFVRDASGYYYYSNSTTSFFTTGSANLPVVTTDSATYSDGYIEAQGYVSSSNYTITERGFVYSTSNSTPTTSDSSYYSSSGTGRFNSSISVSSYYDKYYVRAYAKNNYGTGYGSTITVYLNNSGYPSVSTDSITNVDDYGADIDIYVSSNGNSSIYERGVVYSTSNSTPTRDNSSYRTISGSTGYGTVSLTGLSAYTKYYVRAYATNSNGTSYGSVKTFTTSEGSGDSSYIRTTDITNITGSSATINGYAYSSGSGYSISEKGFVYSGSSKNPTISSYKVNTKSSSTGSYSLDITGLYADTTYYVRAYVKLGSSYYYGKTLEFTTTSGKSSIYISYRNTNGLIVGNQTLEVSYNSVITANNLYIPAGYSINSTLWQYKVNGSASITVDVRPTSTIETPFMPGVANYMFKPEEAITRKDVAQILYNLSNKMKTGVSINFVDVPNDYHKTAINYVTAQGYMFGYPDKSFKPNGTLTRAEMAAVLCKFYKLEGWADSNFSDVKKGYWAYNVISLAVQNGIILGYPDRSYKPENKVTRAEATTMFVKMEQRSLLPLGTQNFLDVPTDYWAYKYIMNAATPNAY